MPILSRMLSRQPTLHIISYHIISFHITVHHVMSCHVVHVHVSQYSAVQYWIDRILNTPHHTHTHITPIEVSPQYSPPSPPLSEAKDVHV